MTTLSPRERQVAELVADGLLDKEIQLRIGCSYGTVRRHVERAAAKLRARNRVGLAVAVVRMQMSVFTKVTEAAGGAKV